MTPKMSTFTLAISVCHFKFTLIHGSNIPGSYAILLFITSDFTSITSDIHNWVLFLLWLCLFTLSGVISPLISSSILGTYCLGSSSFSVHVVYGVLKAWILKWFAIPFSSGPRFVRTLHRDLCIFGGPQGMAQSFTELEFTAVVPVIRLVSFLWLWLSDCLPSDGEG